MHRIGSLVLLVVCCGTSGFGQQYSSQQVSDLHYYEANSLYDVPLAATNVSAMMRGVVVGSGNGCVDSVGPLGDGGCGLQLSPGIWGVAYDERYHWITNFNQASVTVYQPFSDSTPSFHCSMPCSWTYPLPFTGWRGIAFDGTHMWIANSEHSCVARINATDGSGVSCFPTGPGAMSVAIDPKNVWVTNHTGNTVSKLDEATGARLGNYSTGGITPWGICYVPIGAGSMWITNSGSNTVTAMSLDGAILGTYPTGAVPRGLAFDGRSVWVANSGDGTTTKFALDGTVIGTYSTPGQPFSLWFDGQNMWITDRGSNRVYVR